MPISPLRMSVMRGAKIGSVKGFQPLEKEVYTLGSKAKAKLGGKVIKGTDKGKGYKGGGNAPARLDGGPAWQKTDQAKESEKKWGRGGNKIKPVTGLKTLPAKFTPSGDKKKENGFNSLAAGSKSYGQSGRSAPNIGPTSNKSGYAKRDAKLAAAKSTKASYYESSRKAKK